MEDKEKSLIDGINELVDEIKNDADVLYRELLHDSKYTVEEDANAAIVKYLIPGASTDDISLKIQRDILRLEVKKSDMFRGLMDSIWIPENVSINNITSKYINGILFIVLPYSSDEPKDSITIEIE